VKEYSEFGSFLKLCKEGKLRCPGD